MIDKKSRMLFRAQRVSPEWRERSDKSPGIKQKQLVKIAPLTTSRDGNITNISITKPIV